jgi:hypothetical protein
VGKSEVRLKEGETAIQPDVNLQNSEGCGDPCKKKGGAGSVDSYYWSKERMQVTPWEGRTSSHHTNCP